MIYIILPITIVIGSINTVYGQSCSSVIATLDGVNPSIEDSAVLCANENGGNCVGPGRIYYGNGNQWAYKYLGIGQSISCSNSGFGCDPTPNVYKSCYRACPNNIGALPSDAVYCGSQLDGKSCTGPGRVYFGSN